MTPTGGTRAPAGLAIFSYKNGGVTVAEAGVQALAPATAFRLYAEASGNFDASEAGSIQTGFAIANSSSTPTDVTFELTQLDGSFAGVAGPISVPANGQVAMFLNQVEGLRNLPSPFQGVLRISGTGISVVGLRGRYNERRDFLITTTTPVDESVAASSAPLVFPHFADGGGYTTQFILFSGSAGQTAGGELRFFDQAGRPVRP